MGGVCVVLPVSCDVGVGVVNEVVSRLRCQSVSLDVVVSVWGFGFDCGGVVGARVGLGDRGHAWEDVFLAIDGVLP